MDAYIDLPDDIALPPAPPIPHILGPSPEATPTPPTLPFDDFEPNIPTASTPPTWPFHGFEPNLPSAPTPTPPAWEAPVSDLPTSYHTYSIDATIKLWLIFGAMVLLIIIIAAGTHYHEKALKATAEREEARRNADEEAAVPPPPYSASA